MIAAAHRTTALVAAVAVLVACGPVLGQGLDSTALVRTFGISSATTTRTMGMGGPISCVWDLGIANPAFAATMSEQNVSVRSSMTNFEVGPDLDSLQGHFIYPLKDDASGIQISYFSLSSDTGPTLLPGNPLSDVEEKVLSLHYGHRLNERTTVGIGVSPVNEVELHLSAPGAPPLLDVKAESDWGARMGLAYEVAPDQYLGLVWDHQQDTAEGGDLLLGGPARRVFWTDLIAVGASWSPGPGVLLAAEWRRGSINDGALSVSQNTTHFGAECSVSGPCAVRVGLNDGRPTFGVGYKDDRWDLNYAFVARWNDDVATAVWGPSETHGLQATYRW